MIDHGFGIAFTTIDDEHLETLRRWRNDPRVWRWCRQNDMITQGHHLDWWKDLARNPVLRMYVICDPQQARRAYGVAGLTDIDFYNRRAEISCYIHPDVDCLIEIRALKTLMAHAFKTLGLNQLWIESFKPERMRQNYVDAGMRYDGVRREFYFRDGKFHDAFHYSILAREFLEAAPMTWMGKMLDSDISHRDPNEPPSPWN